MNESHFYYSLRNFIEYSEDRMDGTPTLHVLLHTDMVVYELTLVGVDNNFRRKWVCIIYSYLFSLGLARS